jgi:hypothetical protein
MFQHAFGPTLAVGGVSMSFRVDKTKRGAQILLVDGTHLAGHFFLSPYSPVHGGGERVLDLLTGDAVFLPFQLRDGGVVLIRRDLVAVVSLAQGEMDEELPFVRKAAVAVSLVSGETMEGDLYVDAPENRSRISDFFNHCEDFFYLQVGETQYLVNARCVKLVRPNSA